MHTTDQVSGVQVANVTDRNVIPPTTDKPKPLQYIWLEVCYEKNSSDGSDCLSISIHKEHRGIKHIINN